MNPANRAVSLSDDSVQLIKFAVPGRIVCTLCGVQSLSQVQREDRLTQGLDRQRLVRGHAVQLAKAR